MKKSSIWLILAVAFVLGRPGYSVSATNMTVNLEPNEVMIGALFSGATISLSGTVPAGSELMVVLTGEKKDLTLKKKGRALGILWMNLGSVHFQQVPTVYLLRVSKDVQAFARSNPDRWKELGVSLDCLMAQAEISPETAERGNLCGEFLKLKQGEGLYSSGEATVQYNEAQNGMRTYRTELFIPPRIPPGEYEMRAMAVKDGSVVATAVQPMKVKPVGVPAILSTLSFQHGTLYGFLAVIIAIGAGLLMDFLFGGPKGSH